MTTTTREIRAWDLEKGMKVRNPDTDKEQVVQYVTRRKNQSGKRGVLFEWAAEFWWVGSRTEVEIIEEVEE